MRYVCSVHETEHFDGRLAGTVIMTISLLIDRFSIHIMAYSIIIIKKKEGRRASKK